MNATVTMDDATPLRFDCEQTVRRLWDYLDGELGPVELAAVDAHLAECERCPRHFAFERHFLEAVRAARRNASMPDAASLRTLRDQVLARLKADGIVVSLEDRT